MWLGQGHSMCQHASVSQQPARLPTPTLRMSQPISLLPRAIAPHTLLGRRTGSLGSNARRLFTKKSMLKTEPSEAPPDSTSSTGPVRWLRHTGNASSREAAHMVLQQWTVRERWAWAWAGALL
jgi:hypothetical protein